MVVRKETWSNCCGAPVYDDSDICSDCKEHCGLETYCPDCDGTGKIDVMIKESFASQRINPHFEKQKCETCNGEGYIEVEL
jgi:DnaJ-class molecular chaperone